ncbi:MAG: Smr/MutS family protein [bacterium]
MNEPDLARLGYHDVLIRMARGTFTPRGSRRLNALRPAEDAPEVHRRQQVHAEAARRASGDERIPLREIPGLDPLLKRLRKPGVVLEGPELWDIRLGMGLLDELGAYQSSHRQGLEVFTREHGTFARYGREVKRLDGALEQGGGVRDDATPELARLRRRIRSLENSMRSLAASIAQRWAEEGWAQEPEPVLREGRLVVAVRSDATGQTPGAAVDRSRSGQTLFIEPAELSEAGLELKETLREEALEVERILADLTAMCSGRAADIDGDLDRAAVLDLVQATSRWSEAGPSSLPEVAADLELRIRRARHPILAATHGWEEVVPLSLRLDPEHRTLVISGPNAGGKTVALQTVGLTAAMAQAGLPVPADEDTRFPFLEQIFVDIGDEQSVEADLSTFTAHIKRIEPMLAARGASRLCLIDEAGAGTDPAQGAALSMAVLERLTADGAWTVCTTHNGRIKQGAAQAEGMLNGRMVFSGESLTPTYEFVPGEPGRSFAFEIAERAGLESGIVRRGREFLDPAEMDLERALREAEDLRDRLQRAEREAAEEHRKAGGERQRYEALRSELEEHREQARREAEREARQMVKETRRRIEHLVKELRESRAGTSQVKEAHRELQRLEEEHPGEEELPAQEREVPFEVRPGEEVYVRNLKRPATVESVDGARARVQAGSLNLDVAVEQLEPLAAARERGRTGSRSGTGSGSGGGGGVSVPVKDVSDRLELIGMRTGPARRELEKFLDDALLADLKEIIIIHGVGTGALRNMVAEVLESHPGVASHGLDTESYGGDGVTRARLEGAG